MISCAFGRKAGGQHQMRAVRQVAQVVAVLVHDRQPLDAQVGRPGLGDIDDPGVEVAALAGQPLVDIVGHGMGDVAPGIGRAAQRQALQMLFGEHVPEAELDGEQAAVAGHDAPRHERLRIDDAPVLEARPHRHPARLADEGGRIDRAEQARALQIAGDHLGDLSPDLRIRLGRAGEIDDRDRQRLHLAARDVHLQLGPGAGAGARPGNRQREHDGAGQGHGAAGRACNESAHSQQSFHRRTVASFVSAGPIHGGYLTPAA